MEELLLSRERRVDILRWRREGGGEGCVREQLPACLKGRDFVIKYALHSGWKI